MKDLKFDLNQICYLQVLVKNDLVKCSDCKHYLRCGFTQAQCDSYKRIKREVLDILKNALS